MTYEEKDALITEVNDELKPIHREKIKAWVRDDHPSGGVIVIGIWLQRYCIMNPKNWTIEGFRYNADQEKVLKYYNIFLRLLSEICSDKMPDNSAKPSTPTPKKND